MRTDERMVVFSQGRSPRMMETGGVWLEVSSPPSISRTFTPPTPREHKTRLRFQNTLNSQRPNCHKHRKQNPSRRCKKTKQPSTRLGGALLMRSEPTTTPANPKQSELSEQEPPQPAEPPATQRSKEAEAYTMLVQCHMQMQRTMQGKS